MIPIEQLLWRDPEENAAMIRNLNAQAARRECPPCTGNCDEGRRCPVRLHTSDGGARIDAGLPITMYEPDLMDRLCEWSLRITGALALAAAVGLCIWLILNAPWWAF